MARVSVHVAKVASVQLCDVIPGSKNNIQLVEDQANPDIVG